MSQRLPHVIQIFCITIRLAINPLSKCCHNMWSIKEKIAVQTLPCQRYLTWSDFLSEKVLAKCTGDSWFAQQSIRAAKTAM